MKCQRNHSNQIEEEIESGNNYDIRHRYGIASKQYGNVVFSF